MLSERIKLLRLNKDLTQKDLANRLNLTPKMISFYELGDRVPPPDMLEKLADIFEVTTDYLLGRTDKIFCHDCGFWFDPLNENDVCTHNSKHKKWKDAVAKYGFCWNYIKSDETELIARRFLSKRDLDSNTAAEYAENILKAMFSNELRDHEYSYPYDFGHFVTKQLEKSSLRDIMTEDVCAILEKKYETWRWYESDVMPSVINSKDERDIKKDLDSLMEKLSSKEYGPAAYDGEELSEDSVDLFRDELELALRRLKLINKEKYNPNKNKK